jgi:hypothetical protein
MPKAREIDKNKLVTTQQDFEAILKKAATTKPIKSSPKSSKT